MSASTVSKSSARNLPAVAFWQSGHDDVKYLGYKVPEPHCSSLLDVRLDAGAQTAFVKLRVPVWLKDGTDRPTTLYVFIHPERVSGVEVVTGEVPAPVSRSFIQHKQCKAAEDVVGVRFALRQPADVIVPEGRLLPRPKFNLVLELLHSLGQATELTVYVPSTKKNSPRELLRRLGALVGEEEGGLKSTPADCALERLYAGAGGRLLSEGDLEAALPESPPSYDEIALTPPPRPPKRVWDGSSPTTSAHVETEGKRSKSGRSAEDLECELRTLTAQIEDIKKHLPAASANASPPDANALQSKLADVELKVDGLREDMEAMRTEMRDQVARLEKTFDDKLEDAIYRVEEDLNYQLDQVQSHASDEMDIKIDDRILLIKEEAHEAVREEAEATERRLRHDLSRAVVSIDFPDGSP